MAKRNRAARKAALRAAKRALQSGPPRLAASGYRAAGGQHPVLRNWSPGMRSGHAALRFDRERLSSRIHDLVRNDGWASAATSRFLDNIVGAGFRLSAKPAYKALGITIEQAREVAAQIEAAWSIYVSEPGFWSDMERMGPMASNDGMAVRHLFADGEALGFVGWRPSPVTGYGTCLHVLDPVRLSNPNGVADTDRLRDGVELDAHGAAIAYHIRRSHPGDLMTLGQQPWKWDRFERETVWGRPQVLHLREKQWAGMTRSASDLAPVAVKMKQVNDYDDSELQAAALNAKLAAVITTPLDPDALSDMDDLAKYAQSEADYYNKVPLELDGVNLTFLHPGSQLTTVKAEHPHSNFEAFERNALRNIASAAGMSYEVMTADFSQANYSSIRASLVEFRKSWARKTAMVCAMWKMPFYMAWLEDAIDMGVVKLPAGAPSFHANPAAWAAAKWIGPGFGWVDPLKEADAASMRVANNFSTIEDEVANQGGDWQEVMEQRARERAKAIELGLDPDAGQMETRTQSTVSQDPEEPKLDPVTGEPVDPEEDQPAARRRASLVPQIRRRAA